MSKVRKSTVRILSRILVLLFFAFVVPVVLGELGFRPMSEKAESSSATCEAVYIQDWVYDSNLGAIPVYAAVCYEEDDCPGDYECIQFCCKGCVYGWGPGQTGPYEECCDSGCRITEWNHGDCAPAPEPTDPPPTNTPVPPTNTPVPPTNTPVPPTDRPPDPTDPPPTRGSDPGHRPTATPKWVPVSSAQTGECIEDVSELHDKYGEEGKDALTYAIDEDLYTFPFCPEDPLLVSVMIDTLPEQEDQDIFQFVGELFGNKELTSELDRSEATGAFMLWSFPDLDYEALGELVKEYKYSQEAGFTTNKYAAQIIAMEEAVKLYEQGLSPPLFGVNDPATNMHWVIWLHRYYLYQTQ